MIKIIKCNCPSGLKPYHLHAPNCPVKKNSAVLLDLYDGGTWAPTATHSDDRAVDEFAQLMKQKMAASRAKGRGGWNDPNVCSVQILSEMLHDHVAKGDPLDVANFCMMLQYYGAKILPMRVKHTLSPQVGSPEFDPAEAYEAYLDWITIECTWQPIETAPKDGSEVLLRSKRGGLIANGYWLQAAYDGNGAWIWPYLHGNPTEWMRVPGESAPPQKPVSDEVKP